MLLIATLYVYNVNNIQKQADRAEPKYNNNETLNVLDKPTTPTLTMGDDNSQGSTYNRTGSSQSNNSTQGQYNSPVQSSNQSTSAMNSSIKNALDSLSNYKSTPPPEIDYDRPAPTLIIPPTQCVKSTDSSYPC
jgi:hypothetical protein